MNDHANAFAIALARIAEEAERKTGTLDLGGLGLEAIPPEIRTLNHLSYLNFGKWPLQPDGTPDFGNKTATANVVSDLSPIEGLAALERLNFADTSVVDLSPLAALQGLRVLDCSGVAIADLGALSGLSELEELDCSRTRVSDLAPLSKLLQLKKLRCCNTSVSDLAPVSALTELRALDCSITRVVDLAPLATLSRLQELECWRTSVSDLAPLVNQNGLKSMSCSGTLVSDLGPLSVHLELKRLDCVDTRVADLSPLSVLAELDELDICGTLVTDLSPVSGMARLRALYCSSTKIVDLRPLSTLTALQLLDCSCTQVASLAPLSGTAELQTLVCWGTPIEDLAPLSSLMKMEHIDCSHTAVADLSPLSELRQLLYVDCSRTTVGDLTPLADLPHLREVIAHQCKLNATSPRLWRNPSLQLAYLDSTTLHGVPSELLSSDPWEDCLPRLRAHFDDLEAGALPLTDVKLLVLGNGRAGKTQLVRRLRGPDFPYEPEWNSTHGVQIATALLSRNGTGDSMRLHIWDFGGQDLYHGTHTLFTRARALFATVWASDTESTAEYEREGISFRNHPLAYWVSYVRNNGGSDCPLLIVQSKCDTQADERRRLPLDEALLDALPYVKPLHYSAAKDRGRAALNEALGDAVEWLCAVERMGAPLVGRNRLVVQRQLEALRDADCARPPAERLHRTIGQALFREICDEAGGVSNPVLFLEYLNNCGVVFYRPGLFGDAIVLDQAWALDAIYAVFQRDKCYRHLRATGGRFTRLLLDAMIWSAFTLEEQRLFLSMMKTSGICFPHRQGKTCDDDETEYIAPDLLPERASVQTAVDALWDADAPSESAIYRYSFDHPGLIRALIARIGNEAGMNAQYWKGGVALYEATTRSRAQLDYEAADDWTATLLVRTQKGEASDLLRRLCSWVEESQAALGVSPTEVPRLRESPLARRTSRPAESQATTEPDDPPLIFTSPPSDGPQWYVSYAWGDNSQEGRERENIVDRLCEHAAQQGHSIQRDKSALSTGDSISAFMRHLGQGDRVFVILSEKYLRSPFCMFELFEVWRSSRQDPERFRRRVRVYALPDAKIFSPLERTKFAIHWKDQHAELDGVIRTHGAGVLGEGDFRQFKLMAEFAGRVADVLGVIADVVLPSTFEELAEYGFSEAPPQETSIP